MKTKHLLIALSTLLAGVQTPGFSQTKIAPLIEPGKSRGFTTWAPVKGATAYTVEVYTVNKDVQNLISSTRTTKNYVHLDPLTFTIPNVKYKIKALSNGKQVAESDLIPNAVPIGHPEQETVCTKICNGKTVAWKMENFGVKHYTGLYDSNGDPAYYLGSKRLALSTAYQYYNPTNGTYVPFWQAVSTGQWSSILNTSPTHPYVQVSGSQHPLYQIVPISSMVASGPFYNAQNSPVTDGKLIEKKLDEYAHFSGVSTSATADAGTNMCSEPINGWIWPWVNFFNDHADMSGVMVPTGVHPSFNGGVTPCCIECDPVLPGGSGGSGGSGVDWHTWLTYLHKAVDEIELNLAGGNSPTGPPLTWKELTASINDFGKVVSTNGDHVTGVTINSIADDRVRVGYTSRNSAFSLVSGAGDVAPGLYAITLFTSDGNAIPTVLEIKKDLATAKQRELAKISVTPNPVENKLLVIRAETSKNVKAKLLVHNLSGSQVYSASVSLISGSAFEKKIDIKGISTPMQQLRVSLIFADGSILQQTAQVVE